MPTILKSGKIVLRQPEPPEGRWAIPLTSPPIDFVTGAEIFQFDTAAMGPVQPSGILSMWVDATGLASGKTLTITMPHQTLQIPGGTQGYIIITSQMPFTMAITASGTGIVYIVLYNYNVYNTGTAVTVNAQGSGQSGSQPGGGSGSGSGGYSGGKGGNTF